MYDYYCSNEYRWKHCDIYPFAKCYVHMSLEAAIGVAIRHVLDCPNPAKFLASVPHTNPETSLDPSVTEDLENLLQCITTRGKFYFSE